MATTHTPRFRGQKWLNEARYITPETRAAVEAAVSECREQFPQDRTVGVRAGSYIGEPSPIAVVTYNAGGSVFSYIYQS